jgi:hypothetical protein
VGEEGGFGCLSMLEVDGRDELEFVLLAVEALISTTLKMALLRDWFIILLIIAHWLLVQIVD